MYSTQHARGYYITKVLGVWLMLFQQFTNSSTKIGGLEKWIKDKTELAVTKETWNMGVGFIFELWK